ncbi:MAG: ferritin-like domain-containing protein [Burkholderiales bacterium]
MDNDNVISTLNDLIQTSRDGEEGFKQCAENASDPQLKSVFSECAQSCAEGARELQSEVRRLGGNPETGGSVGGAMHRGWVDVKGAVTGKDDEAILNETERGEDAAVESYRNALNSDLPDEVRTMVERQFEGVQQNHDMIRELRDQYASR